MSRTQQRLSRSAKQAHGKRSKRFRENHRPVRTGGWRRMVARSQQATDQPCGERAFNPCERASRRRTPHPDPGRATASQSGGCCCPGLRREFRPRRPTRAPHAAAAPAAHAGPLVGDPTRGGANSAAEGTLSATAAEAPKSTTPKRSTPKPVPDTPVPEIPERGSFPGEPVSQTRLAWLRPVSVRKDFAPVPWTLREVWPPPCDSNFPHFRIGRGLPFWLLPSRNRVPAPAATWPRPPSGQG